MTTVRTLLSFTVVGAAALIVGCGDTATQPSHTTPDDQAEVTTTLEAFSSLLEDGLAEDASQTALAPSTPGTAQDAIELRAFWRRIETVRRAFEFAFADSDSTGRPTTAVVTIHTRLLGTLHIVPEDEQETADWEHPIVKPLADHAVRRVRLRRMRTSGDGRERWRIVAVSGVEITSRNATTDILSVRIRSEAGFDSTVVEPLALVRLRRILRFEPGETLTLTVTTSRVDDTVLLYRAGHRRPLQSHGDGTYTGSFAAGRIEGWRHFGVNALSHGTLHDDTLPYDSKAWVLPYALASTAEVDYLP